jgi:hypothetical protein
MKLGEGAVFIALLLSACGQADWKPGVVADAEKRMKDEIVDPSAQFSRIQITGDDRTGQTCGYVYGRFTADGLTHMARFIVYIDTPMPYVEGGLGRQTLSQDDFERDWQSDCVNEGYKS